MKLPGAVSERGEKDVSCVYSRAAHETLVSVIFGMNHEDCCGEM